MSEDVTLVCKRLDYKGTAAFCTKINEMFADGYTIVIGTQRTDAPRLVGAPRLVFRKATEAVEKVEEPKTEVAKVKKPLRTKAPTVSPEAKPTEE